MTLSRSRMNLFVIMVAFLTIIGGFMAAEAVRGSLSPVHAAPADRENIHMNCAESPLCTEVNDPSVFPGYKYVGHDEPSNLFYSNVPGSGNRNLWFLRLPKDPTPGPGNVPLPGQTFNFELHPTFWFGMAMCDTQSYPETVSTCTPDSDSNIVDPAVSPNHPGTAFMELQFYPPGWVEWPNGNSCDPTQWCAALNIDSLSESGITGATLNSTCANQLFGTIEYINFAFVTKNGVSQAPASPKTISTSLAPYTPDPAKDLFMNSGDLLAVAMHDSPSGLHIDIIDTTTGQRGSMTASASNGFAQIQYAPTGTSCNAIPYDFHPMYSTSSPQTRVIWAAHSYNIAFADEIGHFDFCSHPNPDTTCSGTEGGAPSDPQQEPTDADEAAFGGCFDASQSSLIQVNGCLGTNNGFDGVPYQNNAWPDGNANQPTPIQFTSPLTGPQYNVNYKQSAFEANLPRVEANNVGPGSSNNCQRFPQLPNPGTNCFLFPLTDDSPMPSANGSSTGPLIHAPFYPYFSDTDVNLGLGKSPQAQCMWQIGDSIPGSITDFGKNSQYGSLLTLSTLPQGTPFTSRINNFRQIFAREQCPVHPSLAATVQAILGT